MMKPSQMISILLIVVSVGVFTGCGKQETASSFNNEMLPPLASEATEKEEPGQVVKQQTFDEIKWKEIKDPLIEEGMIVKLQAVIAAFVANNSDQFHDALAPTSAAPYDYLLEQPVVFTGIDKAIKEHDRILVPVLSTRLTKNEGLSPDALYTFYFEKTKDGSWEIVAID